MNPAPLNYSISDGINGSYDNIVLKPKGQSNWRHPPSNTSQYNNKIFVPQGHQIPLKYEENLTNLDNNSMFIFANNKTSLECCPSTYTTSTGCVCTTPQQRKYINQERGGNVTYPSI